MCLPLQSLSITNSASCTVLKQKKGWPYWSTLSITSCISYGSIYFIGGGTIWLACLITFFNSSISFYKASIFDSSLLSSSVPSLSSNVWHFLISSSHLAIDSFWALYELYWFLIILTISDLSVEIVRPILVSVITDLSSGIVNFLDSPLHCITISITFLIVLSIIRTSDINDYFVIVRINHI